MGGFGIRFTDEVAAYDASVAVGEIRLGRHQETFHAETSFWSRAEYEHSWRAALRRVVEGSATSCLVVSISDPESAHFLTTWPLYRFGETVRVQEQILFLDALDRPFDARVPWESVDPCEDVDEDGRRISTWQTSVAEVRSFLDRGHSKAP